jgi:hypothetical protein
MVESVEMNETKKGNLGRRLFAEEDATSFNSDQNTKSALRLLWLLREQNFDPKSLEACKKDTITDSRAHVTGNSF